MHNIKNAKSGYNAARCLNVDAQLTAQPSFELLELEVEKVQFAWSST